MNQDFGETDDHETRYTLARQLFRTEVPMEIVEPDQQQPQAHVACKQTGAKRRSRIGTKLLITQAAQPTRRITKPYIMIPENWEPVSIACHHRSKIFNRRNS